MIADTMEEAVEARNARALEHLVLAVQNPEEWLPSSSMQECLPAITRRNHWEITGGPNHTFRRWGRRFAASFGRRLCKKIQLYSIPKQALKMCRKISAGWRNMGSKACPSRRHTEVVMSRFLDQKLHELESYIP